MPLIPCITLAGGLAGLAVYVGRRNLAAAVAAGVLVSGATFIGTVLITLARWEG